LKVLGQAIALGSLYGLLIQPMWNMYKFFSVPGRLGKVKSLRIYATLSVITAAIIGFGFVPLPSHVYCPLEVQARKADSVYVWQDGILEKTFVQPGDHVAKGQLLAQLKNVDVDFDIEKLTGQRNVFQAQLQGLNLVSLTDRKASSEIEPITKSLASTTEQLTQRETDRNMLRLISPRAGTVLPPPLVEKQGDESVHLPTWHGSPLEPENLGAHLVKGTKFCQVGDPQLLEARLAIDQGDIEFVAPGQKVEVMLTQSAEYVYVSTIERVSTENEKTTPTHLSSLHGGDLPSKADASGAARPLSPIYEAVVPLPENAPNRLMRIGLVGKAKISTPPRTLWARLVRYLSHTFNFEL
jgi:putative peptide zinc metalloprotease protein